MAHVNARLNRVAGQVRGMERIVGADAPCGEILTGSPAPAARCKWRPWTCSTSTSPASTQGRCSHE